MKIVLVSLAAFLFVASCHGQQNTIRAGGMMAEPNENEDPLEEVFLENDNAEYYHEKPVTRVESVLQHRGGSTNLQRRLSGSESKSEKR